VTAPDSTGSNLTPAQMRQLERFAPDHARVVRRMQRSAKAAKPKRSAQRAEAEAPVLEIDLGNYPDRLTVGDMEDIERATGVPALSMSFFGGPRTAVSGVAALIWTLQRKVDPTFTYKAARELPMPVLLEAMAALRAPEAEAEDTDDAEAVGGPLDERALPSA
jgi:hypothetical protein